MPLGDPPHRHGVAEIRLRHRVGAVSVSTTYHVAATYGPILDDDVKDAAEYLGLTWDTNLEAPDWPGALMGSGVELFEVLGRWAPALGAVRFLRFLGDVLPLVPGATETAQPANVTVAVGHRAAAPGHFGSGWTFFPFPSTALLSPTDPSQLAADAGGRLKRAMDYVISRFADAFESRGVLLVVYHRNSRVDLLGPVWWDAVLRDSSFVRSPWVSELKVRLPRHERSAAEERAERLGRL